MTTATETVKPAAPNAMSPLRDNGELTQHDLYLFNEGSHFRLYNKLGAHPRTVDGVSGTYFAVWAPAASGVFLMGDFNGWRKDRTPLHAQGSSGIWAGFIPGIVHG